METLYVNKKSELTNQKEFFESIGCKVYRTHLPCNCTHLRYNGRYGAIVINHNNIHELNIIRCRACVKREEAENGNVQ